MMNDKTPRSEAQKAAERRYSKKRLRKPSIAAIRLTEEEAAFCEGVFERYEGTKKSAVLAGLKLLGKKLK